MTLPSGRSHLPFLVVLSLACACAADPSVVVSNDAGATRPPDRDPTYDDGGSPPPLADAGTAPVVPDAGAPSRADAGTPRADAGTPLPDAGPPTVPTATSIDPPRHIVLEQPGVVDTLRAAQDRSFNHSPFQSTGYWVRQGDVLRVAYAYSGPAPSQVPEIWIHSIDDDTWSYSTDQKVKLQAGSTVDITASHQGIVYAATFNANTGGEMTVDLISGGRIMPRFLAPAHTNAQWSEMLAAYSSAPYAELVGARMMVTTSLARARTHVDDPNALMRRWNEIVRLEDEQYGLLPGNSYPHAPDPHRYHFVELAPYDGWMYAWQYRMAAATAALPAVLDSRELGTNGWGPWHELGHHHQMGSMTWNDQTEVTVNLSSAYVQRALGLPMRFETGGNYTAAFNYLNQSTRDFAAQSDPFVRAIMFWQLDLTFGRSFYAAVARNLRNVPTASRPTTSEARIQHFVIHASRVAGYDLTPFFVQWGVPVSTTTRSALSSMGLRRLTDAIWLNRDTNVRFRLTPAQ